MQRPDPPFDDSQLKAAFAAFAPAPRASLLKVRSVIYQIAAETPGVGPLQETLKWGQPAYLTSESGSGTPLRLGVPKQGGFAIYAHCQTRVIPDFREVAGDNVEFDGNRGVLFDDDATVPVDLLRILIRGALTYHMH